MSFKVIAFCQGAGCRATLEQHQETFEGDQARQQGWIELRLVRSKVTVAAGCVAYNSDVVWWLCGACATKLGEVIPAARNYAK